MTVSSHPDLVAVSAARFEHHRAPLGIGVDVPRLSWRTSSAPDGWQQVAYEVEVRDPAGEPISSGRVDSAECLLVPWPFRPLSSRAQRSVRVRVWGSAHDEASEWSPAATVEAGLLNPADWTARMVSAVSQDRTSAVLFRRAFHLDGEVASARLYVTAHGVYEAEINGSRIGDDVLAPGWTSYSSRLRYQTYDVTAQVHSGANVLSATVADGWYRGPLSWEMVPDVFGHRVGLLAQLEATLADGRIVVVATDESWQAAAGPIRSATLYGGEHYDATLERPGWSVPGLDDEGGQVEIVDRDLATLVAPDGPPVRRTQEIPVAEVLTSVSGARLLDFGQNLVGRLRIRVWGPRGSVVRIRHAEVLEDGELGTRPLRNAEATDTYTLRGGGVEVWEPRFTFHGFRFAEITGWPGEFDPADVTAVVLHSDMERTGWFECSDPQLNRLHENVVWGMRGNFVDVPTDCPQRDERLGWTGDLQVFAPTAGYLYDCAGLITSWLRDLAADQTDQGIVPLYVPHVDIPGPFGGDPIAQAGWGDAAVIVPWVLYQRFGDLEVLRRQYASMCRWVDGLTARLGTAGLFNDPPFQLGDWLDPAAPPENPTLASTDAYLVATAYRARVAQILSQVAMLLGDEADARKYADLADSVRSAFNDEYVSPNGRIASDSQTAYALALEFSLLPDEEQRNHAGRRLIDVVRRQRHRIATGFLGTPLICDALTSSGASDDAYQLLLQKECPSWLYSVSMGATTIWERWDSMLPDGSINAGEMTSFNHYALGAIADWMHRTVGGLAPAAPGYRELTVAPRPGGGLTSASTTHLTPYGEAQVSWYRADGRLTVDVVVPTGTTAVVTLPEEHTEPFIVASGVHHFECAYRSPSNDPEWQQVWAPAG